MSLIWILNAVFDDKRLMVGIVWCWLIIVLGVFTEMVRNRTLSWAATRPFVLTACLPLHTRLN